MQAIGRRDVLVGGAAITAATALPTAAWASRSIGGLVVDTRFPVARAVRTPAGAWRHEIDGDVTALWYERLDRDWRTPGAAIAGVTGEEALFVLERLAWDRRRRVMRRDSMAGEPGLVRWLIAARGA